MSSYNTLDIIQMCIDELNSTTKEEFDNKKKELGVYNKTYNAKDYISDEIEIIFELDENCVTKQNNISLIVEDEYINSLFGEYDDYNLCDKYNEIEIEINSISINSNKSNIYALAA